MCVDLSEPDVVTPSHPWPMWLMLAVLPVTSCDTVKGIGKDLQRADRKIEDAARK